LHQILTKAGTNFYKAIKKFIKFSCWSRAASSLAIRRLLAGEEQTD